jgi:hypothetical protein
MSILKGEERWTITWAMGHFADVMPYLRGALYLWISQNHILSAYGQDFALVFSKAKTSFNP